MIDIKKAKEAFDKYTSNYDMEISNMKLKYNHTLRVSASCREIAMSLKLDNNVIALAELIGLLHDIGRFEQIKTYNSFDDLKTINHGALGVQILFDDNLIRNFIDTDKYDNLIRKAVLIHNKSSIPECYTEEEKLYSKIVRDADKIDILHLLSNKEYTYDTTDEIVSEKIIDYALSKKQGGYEYIQTSLDRLIFNLIFVYDLNYAYSYSAILKGRYVDIIIDDLNIKNEETNKFIKVLRIMINNDLNKYKGVI